MNEIWNVLTLQAYGLETISLEKKTIHISVIISSLQKKPTTVFMAMRMTLVGVATFSLTRKSSVRMENEQMSTPEPAKADSKPVVKVSSSCFRTPNSYLQQNL